MPVSSKSFPLFLITALFLPMASMLSAKADKKDETTYSYGKKSRDGICLLYTSPSPRDKRQSRMPSSA